MMTTHPEAAMTREQVLEAERDEARNRNARVELEAVGYSNRMHEAIARAEAAEQALTAERQRREDCQLFRNEAACFTELVEVDGPYAVEELGPIDCALIRAMDDRRIIGLRIYTLDPAPADNTPPSTTEAENE